MGLSKFDWSEKNCLLSVIVEHVLDTAADDEATSSLPAASAAPPPSPPDDVLLLDSSSFVSSFLPVFAVAVLVVVDRKLLLIIFLDSTAATQFVDDVGDGDDDLDRSCLVAMVSSHFGAGCALVVGSSASAATGLLV